MYVVILGGGRIGRYIAGDMVQRGHEVTVLEKNRDRAEMIVTKMPVLVIQGDACDVPYLKQANVDRADVFVATTHDDDENLVACQLAMIQFGVPRAISRVNDPKNVPLFEKVGIEPVSSTKLISELLENELMVQDLVHLLQLRGGKLSLVELKVPSGDDGEVPPPVRNIVDLELPEDAILVAIYRGEETVVPRGGTQVLPGDLIVALTRPEFEAQLQAALTAVD